jgi:hypothetical protein
MRTVSEKRDTRLRKNLRERYTDTWRDKCEQWLSSKTTTSKNIKQEYSKMMNPPEIINVNYTPDQEGKEIRQEDVVPPMKRKITTMKEVAKWKEISRSPAPTYGSCEYCFRSGTLGKHCNSLCAQLAIDQRYNDIKDEYVRNTLRRTHWSLFLEWKDNWFD